MQTKLAKQLGIDFPIFAFTHCRDVVAAVTNSGGFGVLGATGFTPEQLEIELSWIDDKVGSKPYGVDVIIPRRYEGQEEKDIEKQRASQNLLVRVYNLLPLVASAKSNVGPHSNRTPAFGVTGG